MEVSIARTGLTYPPPQPEPASRGGSSGSDALSHVYIQHPPIRCNIPETSGLFYDDGTKFLLSPSSDQVLSWKIGSSTPNSPPDSDYISEGRVLAIRFSLDEKMIAIQRSDLEIQFIIRETGLAFSKKCLKDSEKILGFFWTDCPTCDLILIKSSGIEMLAFESETNTFRIIETKKLSVNWFVYSHESRMLLLASGMQSTLLSGYQFSSLAGIVRLPKFEMSMTKSESNSKPVLSSDDVHIITVYGRIYCLQFDLVGMELNLYRFYRDAVVQQGSIPVYSAKVAISTVDNVILIHQLEPKVVMLYDLFLDSYTPISAPLPLLLRGISVINNNEEDSNDSNYGVGAYEQMIYNESWSFLTPDLICDVDNGLVWKVFLDLEAISASGSDIPFIIQFLQRRRSYPAMIKDLCIGITRTVVLERRVISVISQAMDVLVASYSQSLRSGIATTHLTEGSSATVTGGSTAAVTGDASHSTGESSASVTGDHGKSVMEDADSTDNDDNVGADDDDGPRESEGLSAYVAQHVGTSVAISPDEMYTFVFETIEDEMSEDPSYLVSVILEFLRSASREKLKVGSNIYLMIIELLSRSNRCSDIILFVSNKIIEPSREVAMKLLESTQQNTKIRKMGLDMLRLLSLHHDYVSFLLQDGYYLEALRYARKYKVITVQPALFLEAAMGSKKIIHLAAVMRFFNDFAPNFKSTLDYGRYQLILSELS